MRVIVCGMRMGVGDYVDEVCGGGGGGEGEMGFCGVHGF